MAVPHCIPSEAALGFGCGSARGKACGFSLWVQPMQVKDVHPLLSPHLWLQPAFPLLLHLCGLQHDDRGNGAQPRCGAHVQVALDHRA